MKTLLVEIITALVDEQAAVEVTEQVKQAAGKDGTPFEATVFTVVVSPKDTGKIIGKSGEMADALRKILRAIGGKQHKVFLMNIHDHRPPKGGQ